jgi:hypothetical protein
MTITNAARAEILVCLDALGDAAAELRLAADAGELGTALLAELHAGVWASGERLRQLLARLPDEDGVDSDGGAT